MSEPDAHKPDEAPQHRLFLERRGYTQRRIVDGARLLPIVGLVLFMVPLIWPQSGEANAVTTSVSSVYVFLIWFALIVTGGLLAHRINAISALQDSENAPSDPQAASREQTQIRPE